MTTTKKQLKVGVIGCGARMRLVLEHLLDETTGQLQIAAAYDPSQASLKALQAFAPDCRAVAEPESVCKDPELDWICIGSWNAFHAEQVVCAIESGKHVFCEKPLATRYQDALRVATSLEQNPDRTFFFGLVLRYSPFYQKIKAILDSGRIGRIISFEFNETLPPNHGAYIHGGWRRKRDNAGTHLLEKCCHDLDLANWLVGSEPVRVASFGGTSFFTPENKDLEDSSDAREENGSSVYHVWRDANGISPFNEDKDIFDHQTGLIEYANGTRASFHTNCHALLPERRFYICGTRGTLRADVIQGTLEWRTLANREQTVHEDTGVSGSHAGSDTFMVKALADTMLHQARPLAGIQEAMASMRVACAMDEAADQRKVVQCHHTTD